MQEKIYVLGHGPSTVRVYSYPHFKWTYANITSGKM